jgi:uncharacterized RDD family membrane protein YckC
VTLDRDLNIRTAEHVGISYELAGVGNRILAALLDFAFIVLITIGLAIGAFLLIQGLVLVPGVASIASALLIVFLGLVVPFSYWVVLEAVWNGQTLGKRMVGIRVLRDDGAPVGFFAVATRGILRVLDLVPILLPIDLVLMVATRKGQRLGDIVAGTVVVKARISRDFASLRTRAATTPTDITIRGLSGEAQRLVREFSLREATLPPLVRAEVAKAIARSIRPLVPESAEHPDDVDLLRHVAAGLRESTGEPPAVR